MRRTKHLENVVYKKRYKEIYKLVFNADLEYVKDRSSWFTPNPDYLDRSQPLWIILESKILNKRIWITESFKQLSISTAQLDLDVNSKDYQESHEHFYFRNQKELCNKLEELLKPCLEK